MLSTARSFRRSIPGRASPIGCALPFLAMSRSSPSFRHRAATSLRRAGGSSRNGTRSRLFRCRSRSARMSSPSHHATPNVPLSRAWNTWTADRYVEMSFLPLGLRLTPLVYAASVGRVSRFGPGDEVLLGTHAVDGSRVEARLTHAGTVLDWRYRKASPFDLIGGWQTLRTGEWGLRVWVVL